MGVQWTTPTLHYLEMSIGHPLLDGPGVLSCVSPALHPRFNQGTNLDALLEVVSKSYA